MQQHTSGIHSFLAASHGAHKVYSTPSGAQVRLRPATLFELGEIFAANPLAQAFILGGGKAAEDMSEADLLQAALRDFRGATCMLVAACADCPGDRDVIEGLSHKPDGEFFPLLKGGMEMTFPLGLKAKGVEVRQHLASLGIKLSGLSEEPAPAVSPPSVANKPSKARPGRR